LNGSRKVIGVLRGYDVRHFFTRSLETNNARSLISSTPQVFLNIVLDDAVEEKANGEKVRIGMVVREFSCIGHWAFKQKLMSAQVIRGNSVVMLEVLCTYATHTNMILIHR